MLEGLRSGQDFKEMVEEGIVTQEEADSHQEGTVRMRMATELVHATA